MNKKSHELQSETETREGQIKTQQEQNEALAAEAKECSSQLDAQVSKLERAEKSVSELNAKMSTLENFRFVLDTRVHELTAERAPFTEHTASLDKKMYEIYDTLTEKYAEHKRGEEAMIRTDRVRGNCAGDARGVLVPD